jgi:hypothetical protein
MIPAAYRSLLQDRRTRLLLTGLGASSLGDGLSTVTIARLAVRIAPASDVGLFVAPSTTWRRARLQPVRNREMAGQESRSDRRRGRLGSVHRSTQTM